MLNISINEENTIVENTSILCKWTLQTENFFGRVFEVLEKHFPLFEIQNAGSVIASSVLRGISGTTDDTVKIFGCFEAGSTLYNLLSFVDKRSVIKLTLKDIDEMRIRYSMTSAYLPVTIGEKDSMRFEKLRTITQVVIAALYYYAYNGYKLVRCKHCGKWFATKSLKNQFCKRTSPCYGDIIKGKKALTCEAAVQNIRQNCTRLKNSIETKANSSLAAQLGNNAFLFAFSDTCAPFQKAIAEEPTAENLTDYYRFLQKTNKERAWLNR